MPKITNFIFCKAVNIEEGAPQAIDFIQLIETTSENFSFSVMYTITDFTSHNKHTGFVKLFDADDEELVETDEFIVDGEDKEGDKDSNIVTGITMGIEFSNVQFKGSGLYRVELFFDNSKLGEFYIPVILKKEGE